MITQKEYKARRCDLAKRMPVGCIAVIPAGQEQLRNGDAHYRFRQDSHFYYLTGFEEPDALLLVTSGAHSESILFNRPSDPVSEQWTGKRLGQEGACRILAMDAAFSLSELDVRMPELLAERMAIYYTLGRSVYWDSRLLTAWNVLKERVRRGVMAPDALCDLEPILSEMRLFKSSTEVSLMKYAAHASVLAHQRAMRACRVVTHEYELEAELIYELTRQGCYGVAYNSIVAGGERACVLHYTDNNQPLVPGELVLVDAGGEYKGYAADITRTYPINGRFSAEQRLMYELVLQAQTAGIALIKPGCVWDEIQRTMVRILTEGLVDLGLLHGLVDDLIHHEAYKPFYMHSSGHWLGLDVLDCGRYKTNGQWRALEPGMVLTVEPGLYISPGISGVDSRWWGIGVRIEDDVLVTPKGHENLSIDLAVNVDDLEALVRDGL